MSNRLISDIGDDVSYTGNNENTIPDMFIWGGWIRIFSERSTNHLIGFGLPNTNFIACKLSSPERNVFFMYLPDKIYDVIDFNESKFLHTVPMPDGFRLLFHMTSLAFKELAIEDKNLPHCFFAESEHPHPHPHPHPNPQLQSLSLDEMFVSDEFKKSWESTGFTGAHFRKLST